MEIASAIRTLPKIELHEHLDGSLRPDTLLDLALQDHISLPATEKSDLLKILSPGPSSLETYLEAFAVTTAVMQTRQALRRIAFETVEDWYRDGIVYGEVRFAPELHGNKGLRLEEIVESVLDGLAEGQKKYPVRAGLILCSMRHRPPTLATARLVRDYQHDGVVAFDIAGAESGFPPSLHREAFEYCAEWNLSATCHAGEVTSPEYIRQALQECKSSRIGHGVRLIQEWTDSEIFPENSSLASWVRTHQVPLEICLTSNLQTKASLSLDEHPFDVFRRQGLAVTLNTDNRLVSATSLSFELGLAQNHWNLSLEDLKKLQLNSLDAAFCSESTKQELRKRLTF